jgi:hypothetical protein
MTMHDTPNPVRLKLKLEAGSIDITTWDQPRTEVEVTPISTDPEAVEAAANVRQELRAGGEELVVETASSRGVFGIRRGYELRYAISAPHGSSIDASTASADITARGSYGSVKVATASGDVSVDQVDGDLNIKTVSGDTDVERVGGNASLNSVSGDLEVGTVGGDISANVVSGDLHVTQAGGSLNAKGVSGDVTVESLRRGDAKLQSVSGDVSIGVAAGARLWMDIGSMSGHTQSDLEPVSESEAGSIDLRVKASSASGDIRLHRAVEMSQK